MEKSWDVSSFNFREIAIKCEGHREVLHRTVSHSDLNLKPKFLNLDSVPVQYSVSLTFLLCVIELGVWIVQLFIFCVLFLFACRQFVAVEIAHPAVFFTMANSGIGTQIYNKYTCNWFYVFSVLDSCFSDRLIRNIIIKANI